MNLWQSSFSQSLTLAKAFNFLLVLLHKWLTWLSKLNLLSMLTFNNFSQLFFLPEKSAIWISAMSLVLTSKLHLSVILFILFSANHFKKLFRQFLQGTNDLIFIVTCVKVFLSSAYLVKSIFCTTRNKLLRKTLNKIGPSIDLWGPTKSISSEEL